MKKKSVYAGIVTFNPDIEVLLNNIKSIYDQIKKIVIIDNGSKNIEQIEKALFGYSKIELIENGKNLGIATALNVAMKFGFDNNFSWMLTLDQDSQCPKDYVNNMLEYVNLSKNLAIISPVIVDRNTGVVGHSKKNKEYIDVRTCISSGAIVSVEAWNNVGGYDDSMFIDSVDFEFCYRLRKQKYRIIQIESIFLLHKIGKRIKRKFLFWKININGHSAFRKYYISKNNIYYPLKHHLIFRLLRGNFRNLVLLISVLFYEDTKKEKIHSIIQGWTDGYKLYEN